MPDRDRPTAGARTWLLVMLGIATGLDSSATTTRAQETTAPAQPEEPAEQDWASVIGKLRQQVYQRPGHPATRKQLAIAHNNYGLQLAGQGQLAQAVLELQEALEIDPTEPGFAQNLAQLHLRIAQQAYAEGHEPTARQAIERAVAVNPKQASAYALLGQIEYNVQRLKEARRAWETAMQLDPTLPNLKAQLDRVVAELPVESKFERLSQVWFDIRYTERLERPAGFDIRDTLLRARREIGGDFQSWPKQKLVVLVYSAEQFHQLRQDTPEWVAGQFDGKIRVPLPDKNLDKAAVTGILFHEYTHALVHQLTDNRCPLWFNEGLAEYERWKGQEPAWRTLRPALAAGALLPWDALTSQFSTAASQVEVSLAYEQAHSIVHYLIERYGFWRIRQLLKAFANGSPPETVMPAQLHVKWPKLQEQWETWLRERTKIPAPRR